ncbi:hypothetical protein N806_20210 [Rhodococcus sp. P27]|nr:hypothetical protein N806_20210 [Rhodococcus sp. P27]
MDETPAPERHRLSMSNQILRGLQDPRKHVYSGSLDAATKAERRAKNRAARNSRRKNRR